MTGTPAALGKRIAAEAIDLAILGFLGAIFCFVPIRAGVIGLPLIVACVVIFGYTVLPLSVFKATFGMRLLGIEMIALDGRAPDLLDVVQRELLVRGLIVLPYLALLLGSATGLLDLVIVWPGNLGIALFFASTTVALLALCGQILILTRPDRRGLPDLIAKTIVVERGSGPRDPSLPEAPDDEERALFERMRARRTGRFAIFEAVLVIGALIGPYVATLPLGTREDFVDRFELARAEEAFRKNPARDLPAYHYIALLERAGDHDQATEARRKHQEALVEQRRAQEAAIRSTLERDPSDWDAFTTLLEILEEGDRIAEAKTAWAAYLAADPEPDTRVTYGIWLYDQELPSEALAELDRAIAQGASGPASRAYRGWSLLELGEDVEARRAFREALVIDPELEQVRADLEALEEKLGPEEVTPPPGSPSAAPARSRSPQAAPTR